MPIRFDPATLIHEFGKLKHFNPKLCEILSKLQDTVHTKYQKNITITQVHRGQEKNDSIYKNTNKPHRKTAHGVWAAVDIRSRDFSADQISEIVTFLNAYNDSNSNPIKGGNTALYHSVGKGLHIHIQYAPKQNTADV